jgi:hypothetical protein
MKIFLIINGLFPDGESKPPSNDIPIPVPSLVMLTISLSFAANDQRKNQLNSGSCLSLSQLSQ